MADRPALKEIEITPEMIEAGVPHLFEYDTDFDNERGVVATIFRAMAGARSPPESSR